MQNRFSTRVSALVLACLITLQTIVPTFVYAVDATTDVVPAQTEVLVDSEAPSETLTEIIVDEGTEEVKHTLSFASPALTYKTPEQFYEELTIAETIGEEVRTYFYKEALAAGIKVTTTTYADRVELTLEKEGYETVTSTIQKEQPKFPEKLAQEDRGNTGVIKASLTHFTYTNEEQAKLHETQTGFYSDLKLRLRFAEGMQVGDAFTLTLPKEVQTTVKDGYLGMVEDLAEVTVAKGVVTFAVLKDISKEILVDTQLRGEGNTPLLTPVLTAWGDGTELIEKALLFVSEYKEEKTEIQEQQALYASPDYQLENRIFTEQNTQTWYTVVVQEPGTITQDFQTKEATVELDEVLSIYTVETFAGIPIESTMEKVWPVENSTVSVMQTSTGFEVTSEQPLLIVVQSDEGQATTTMNSDVVSNDELHPITSEELTSTFTIGLSVIEKPVDEVTEEATEETTEVVTETTDPTGTSTTDPTAQPVAETTQPTSISMFSASALMASPMGLTTPTATTNAYNTSTNPSATTVGTNYGVYSVDVKDFHFWENVDPNRGLNADTTSKMDISIKVPKDAKAGDTFTLSLPPDFNIDSPLNSTEPIGRVYANGDKTTSVIDIYYKTPNGAIPDIQNLQHNLEFRITDAGAKLFNASGQDYDGTFTIGGDTSVSAKDGVAIQNRDGTLQRNLFNDIPYGLNIIINQWGASAPTDTSITKTFTFDSSYNGSTTILKDQSTLLYGNKTAAGAPAGARYIKSYSMEYFNQNIAYTNEVSYYDNGTRYAKISYTLNGGKQLSPTRTTTTFTDNTSGTMTSKVYQATNGDPNTGAYIGPLKDITANASGTKVNGVTLTKNAAGAVTRIVADKGTTAFVPVVYVEQTVKVSSTTGSLIVVSMASPQVTKYSVISDVTFEAEIKPSPVANFVKVVKADRNGDGVLEEYGVTSSPATFRLLDEVGNVLQDNLQTDSKGLLTVSEIKAGVNYILEETSIPTGFKNIPRRIKFFVRDTDNVAVYYDSQNNLVDTSAKGYVPVENELENPHNTLTINKKDQDGNPLPGAEFAIINKDTGITVYRTSGQDGKITLLAAEFPEGHYIIRENKAPKGYDKSTKEKEFWVANGGLYYNTNPSSTASSINNIETANLNYNIEANKTGDSFFGGIVNKLFSSFKISTAYAEAEVDLPYEEATKNYNVGITYQICEEKSVSNFGEKSRVRLCFH